jgi:hypothetical protein
MRARRRVRRVRNRAAPPRPHQPLSCAPGLVQNQLSANGSGASISHTGRGMPSTNPGVLVRTQGRGQRGHPAPLQADVRDWGAAPPPPAQAGRKRSTTGNCRPVPVRSPPIRQHIERSGRERQQQPEINSSARTGTDSSSPPNFESAHPSNGGVHRDARQPQMHAGRGPVGFELQPQRRSRRGLTLPGAARSAQSMVRAPFPNKRHSRFPRSQRAKTRARHEARRAIAAGTCQIPQHVGTQTGAQDPGAAGAGGIRRRVTPHGAQSLIVRHPIPCRRSAVPPAVRRHSRSSMAACTRSAQTRAPPKSKAPWLYAGNAGRRQRVDVGMQPLRTDNGHDFQQQRIGVRYDKMRECLAYTKASIRQRHVRCAQTGNTAAYHS